MSNPYRKSVRHLDEIDIYQIGNLYEVKSHAVFHALKKLLCAGKRGAKDYEQDLMEAIESIERELQMLPAAAEELAVDFDEQRIDVIGQNGNEGEHYEPAMSLDEVFKAALPEDLVIDLVKDFVSEEKADWRNKVDWSRSSPHHVFAYKTPTGGYGFAMHEPLKGEYIRRPVAQ